MGKVLFAAVSTLGFATAWVGELYQDEVRELMFMKWLHASRRIAS